MPTRSEPPIRVPMTRTLRDRLAADIAFWSGPDGLDHLQPLVAAYDAAVAGRAEPGRCLERHCDGRGCGLRCHRDKGHLGEHVWSYGRVSGVVADG